MLKIEATRREKWRSLLLTALYLVTGVSALLVCIAIYLTQADSLSVPAHLLAFVPFSAFHLILGSLRLYLDWVRGRIHTRVLVNRYRLVIFRPGGEVRRIRKRDIMAAANRGRTFVDRNEKRYAINASLGYAGGGVNYRVVHGIYETWWPGLELKDVWDYFERFEPPNVAICIFFPMLPLYVLGGWFLYGQSGTIPLIVLVAIATTHGLLAFWLSWRQEGEFLFHFDGKLSPSVPRCNSEAGDVRD